MGVTGLWRLIEPTGKPVPVETLENKVLAVDISIWLHQVVKGYQDAKGAPLPNAHLMGLFQRLCKLLYFKIKPVFVFDGAFPDLKKETIAKRQDSKARYHSESERLKRELALLLSKKTAVNNLLGKQLSPIKKASRPDGGTDDDIFKLPALPQQDVQSESESDTEDTSSGSIVDLHSVDLESDNFKQLPVKEKYDVLVELKETRKMNSWGRLHELPKKSDNFSDFQLKRLLKRRKVQECLEETEKEMGSTGMSLNDLEALLNEEGIDTKFESLPTRRIASNENTRFLFIKNVKKALTDAKQKNNATVEEVADAESSNEKATEIPSSSKEMEIKEESSGRKNDELEDDLQKAIAMSLECENEPNTNAANTSKTDDSWTSFLTDSDYSNSGSDSAEGDGFEETDMSTAKAYIMQYSDYTHKVIEKMIEKKNSKVKRKRLPRVDEIVEELNKEKSIIADNIDLSSDDDVPSNHIKLELKSEVDSDSDSFDLEPIPEESEILMDGVQDVKHESSVIRVNDSNEVMSLDTSIEEDKKTPEKEIMKAISGSNFEVNKEKTKTISTPEIKLKSESSDSDSEFEEVTDEKTSTPVVEISLKLGEAPDDDIFADVFDECKDNLFVKPMTESKSIGFVKDTKIASVINDGLNFKDIPKIEIETTNNKNIDSDNISLNIENHKETNSAPRPKVKNDAVIATTIEIPEIVPQHKTNTTLHQIVNTEKPKETPNETKTIDKPKEPVSREQLNTMVEEIQTEEQNLVEEKGRLDRIGRNITEQMTKEAQELLQIFGIPYIVAPMEAEAQCAFLESVNLTDGTITDDSDIWLFGGRTVYKNFFNQKKHVLQFVSEKIEKTYNLSREHLILLALLVGSDYTTGVNGVGPVTALEILASFPCNKRQLAEAKNASKYAHLVAGLQEFKKWVRSGRRTDDTSLKKKLKNVEITDDFPSVRVVQAYLEPNVEKSEDKFSWGELDITIIRDYTKAKFGWSQNKVDEIMKPVLKVMQDRQTQRSIQDYFKRKVDFQPLDDQMSKRVKAAVQKMGPDGHTGDQNAPEKAKRKVRKRKNSAANKAPNDNETNEGETSTAAKVPKTKAKQKKVVNEELTSSKIVKVKTINEEETKTICDIKVVTTERFQEVIPQREKDKQSLLQNKMKAIELFRKTKLDPRSVAKKRRANLPKDKAELSESDSD